MAMVPKGSGEGQNCALVCGGQMEQEGRSRMVGMSLVLVGFRPGPGSSVGRAPAASAGVPGSIPGWVAVFIFSSLQSSFSFFFLYQKKNMYIHIYIYIHTHTHKPL